MKIAMIVILASLFQGCMGAGVNLEELVGVDVSDNASLCIETTVQIPAPMYVQTFRFKRVELPADVDTSGWDSATLQAAESAICD